MLLSDEEIGQISLSAVTVKDATEDVRAIEAAILAKLASAELPEPVATVTSNSVSDYSEISRTYQAHIPLGTKLYDKQAMRDLLEAAAVALRDIDALHNAGLVDVTVDALRSMKEKL